MSPETKPANKQIFPEHLYDPVRVRIATELIEKELAKLLPNAGAQKISEDVQSWWSRPEDFKMMEVIDFWDAAESILGGIKLKSLTTMITAANFKWQPSRIGVQDLALLAKLKQLDRLNSIGSAPIKLGDILTALEQNEDELLEQRKIIDSFSLDKSQDSYRIIAEANFKGSKFAGVHDGNRRVLRAALYGDVSLDAWLCDKGGQQPKNYWVPVSLMLRLVKTYRHNKDDPSLVRSLRGVLARLFSESIVAKIAYQTRIIEYGTEGSQELAEGLL